MCGIYIEVRNEASMGKEQILESSPVVCEMVRNNVVKVHVVDEELLMKQFREMCQESLDPETYEMSEIVEKNLRLVRSRLK